MVKFSGVAALKRCIMLVALSAGAGCAHSTAIPTQSPEEHIVDPNRVDPGVTAMFSRALSGLLDADRRQEFDAVTCQKLEQQFLHASQRLEATTGSPLAVALYNAGVVAQRCGHNERAKALYKRAARASSDLFAAKVRVTLADFEQTGDIDAAIQSLESVVRASEFQLLDGLVALAALELRRKSARGWIGCSSDVDCARLNLQRVLAIDAEHLPALNQLTLYYLENARQAASPWRRSTVLFDEPLSQGNQQQLDLASLVASQALRKNPDYAPLHNTTGLVLVELGDFTEASRHFSKARQLAPDFYEAHMNYAALNLAFRGFKEAEVAYKDALRLIPKSYEAHLGLALALRSQIPSRADAALAEKRQQLIQRVDQLLRDAARLEPQRSEAYYNRAVLLSDFSAAEGNTAAYDQAEDLLKQFIRRAASTRELAAAVERAKQRVEDIQAIRVAMQPAVQ